VEARADDGRAEYRGVSALFELELKIFPHGLLLLIVRRRRMRRLWRGFSVK
jgi:hypothetical protein